MSRPPKRSGMDILKEHHIKYGFTVREDDHVATLYAPDGARIYNWAIAGVMSAKEIRDAADNYIIKQFRKGALNG